MGGDLCERGYGASLFGRFALQAAGGLRGGVRELAGVGEAVGRQLGVQQENSCPAVEDGAEGAAVADPAWPGQPLDACRRAAVAVRPAATT